MRKMFPEMLVQNTTVTLYGNDINGGLGEEIGLMKHNPH